MDDPPPMDSGENASLLSARAMAFADLVMETDIGMGPGDVVGPYKILSVLGQGGFGVVYLASQSQPVRRRVALKVIKPGMDSRAVIARFEQERQALAMMDHANVARVLDVGTTKRGLPYFAMEYVKGEAITTYCDRQNLSVRQRLDLFSSVCDAVQHSHMKGIIHRDIKPSNVLVAVGDSGPIVKVIDFGVAKAVSHTLAQQTIFTEHGQMVGTPEYMSPEQAEMGATDVDTRTDVYSLGVLLYELLAGATPFDSAMLRSGGLAEVQRVIREVDPPKPSSRLTSLGEESAIVARKRHTKRAELIRELSRELDWIPLKAMRKDRTQRYSTPIELAEDIENYLHGRPLEAGPEAMSYRVGKFARRNKSVLAATVLILLTLVFGIAGVLLQMAEVREQRDLAVAAQLSEAEQRERAERAAIRAEIALEAAEAMERIGLKQRDIARWRLWIASTQLDFPDDPTMRAMILREAREDWTDPFAERRSIMAVKGDHTRMATLRGHDGPVETAAWSPDGQRIVTASWDRTAKVWNANNEGDPIELRGDTQGPTAAKWSLDGSRYAIVTQDHSLEIHHGSGAEEKLVLSGHTGPVTSVVWSDDGSQLLTTSEDLTARIWSVDGVGSTMVLEGHTRSVNFAAWCPNGEFVVTTSDDHTARVWKVDGTGEHVEFRDHRGEVNAAAWCPYGEKLVTVSWDNTARVWNADGTGDATVLQGHESGVFFAAWSADRAHIVTTSWDRTTRVWNADGSGQARVLRGVLVNHAAWCPRGERVVTTSWGRVAYVWNADGSGEPVVLRGHESGVLYAAWSPDGKRIVTVSNDTTARIWNADGSGSAHVLQGHEALVNFAAWCPNGLQIVTTSWDRTARVWDASTLRPMSVFQGHVGGILHATWSPCGTRVATSATDATTRIWSVDDDDAAPIVLRGHTGAVLNAQWSTGGNRLVTASEDRTARVWDLDHPDRHVVLDGHGDVVNSASFNHDGTKVVTACWDGKARIWEVNRPEKPLVLRGHEGQVNAAMWSPDGSRIVTASSDRTARVWQGNPMRQPRVIRPLSEEVVRSDWSHAGSSVASILADGSLCIVDGETSTVVAHLEQDGLQVQRTAWNPNSESELAMCDSAGVVYLWHVDSETPPTVIASHAQGVEEMRWSGDGKHLIVVTRVGSAWLILPRYPIRSQRLNTGLVRDAIWSPDHNRFVTLSDSVAAEVWSISNLDRPKASFQHTAGITSAAWCPRGERIATSSSDRSVVVWNADDARVEHVFDTHENTVNHVTWRYDGEAVASSSSDRLVRIWSFDQPSTPVAVFEHDDQAMFAAYSPDGEKIAVATADNALHIWNSDGLASEPMTLDQSEGLLSSIVWDQAGHTLLTVSHVGVAKRWIVHWPLLRKQLWHDINDVLSSQERMRYLGESPERAEETHSHQNNVAENLLR